MTRDVVNGIVRLRPDAGKWLTNGETNSKQVFIGKNCSEGEWIEVDEPIDTEEIDDSEAVDVLLGGE